MANAASKPRRSPERAAAVLDRAARMSAFKPSILDRRLFDKQMRTPGLTAQAPFDLNKIDPSLLKNVGVQNVPLAKVKAVQPTVSLAAAKAKLTNPTTKSGQPVQMIKYKGNYYPADGNHRTTAMRALGESSVSARVLELNHEIKPPVVTGQNVAKAMKMAGGVAAPLAVGANAALAYNNTLASGGTKADARFAAVKEGGKAAATAAAIGGTLKAAGSMGLKAASSVAARALVPASIVGHAAAYGIDAWRKGGDGLEIARQSAWGGINGVLPIDLTTAAIKASRQTTAGSTGRTDASGPVRLDRGQMSAFHDAEKQFGKWIDKQQNDGTGVTGGRGFQNPHNQAAAQKAKGNNYTGPTE